MHYEKILKNLFENKIEKFLKEVDDKEFNSTNSEHISMKKWIRNKKREP